MQDAFAQAWQRWDTYSDYHRPEAWVRLVGLSVDEGAAELHHIPESAYVHTAQ